MAGEISSPYMNLPIPTVGVTTGPQWATDLNVSLSLIDSHNHSAGQGIPITPDGMNISSDLPFNNNNLITARSLRLFEQTAALGLATDKRCLYAVIDDLFYNDGLGNQIRITQGGQVVGPPGTITGLVPPASAAYVAANSTFVWQSNVNTSARMDCSSLLIRSLTAGSNAVTLQSPNPVPSNYSLTLPTVPASKKIMTLDASGQMGGDYDLDNVTLEVASNLLRIKDSGVSTVKILDFAVTQAKLYLRQAFTSSGPTGGVIMAPVSGSGSVTTAGEALITNQSLVITTTGRPVKIDMTVSGAFGGLDIPGVFTTGQGFIRLYRNGSFIGAADLVANVPIASLSFLDEVGLSTYTYELRVGVNAGTSTFSWAAVRMIAYELN